MTLRHQPAWLIIVLVGLTLLVPASSIAGMATDEVNAFNTIKVKAENGDVKALSALGTCYDDGIGVEQDAFASVKWWLKAAELGDAFAQASIAPCYMHGHGLKKDAVEAAKWYRKAAEQGVTPGGRAGT